MKSERTTLKESIKTMIQLHVDGQLSAEYLEHTRKILLRDYGEKEYNRALISHLNGPFARLVLKHHALKEHLPVMASALKHKDPGIVHEALEILGSNGGEASGYAWRIAKYGLKHREDDVRMAAVSALGSMGQLSDRIIVELKKTALNDHNKSLRDLANVVLQQQLQYD
ncbi:MAG TPA: HEAT repeat domain-containing protein [Candidatus Norongarragalinales archaeon]|jgi:hypothetical protein|nr:HEAT repeat domain-containing protein [Candidatus Norongarragalinales archaeon]